MGLDVTAFEKASLLPSHALTDECWDDHERAYIIDPDFSRSLRGLEADRCYEVGGRSIHVGNSYGGHGEFRRCLATIFLGVGPEVVWAAPDEYADHPFFELIHFADNEGTIGPEAAADLAADFAEGREKWRAEKGESDFLLRKYDEWADALKLASNGGLVRFA